MYFILTPDALSASQVKTSLAKESITNLSVGPFQSLLDALDNLWLLPEIPETQPEAFQQQLKIAAFSMNGAFWAESLLVDEQAVLQDLSSSLMHLYDDLPFDKTLSDLSFLINNEKQRVPHYLSDLIQLATSMSGLRPYQQEKAKQWISEAGHAAIEPLTIIVPQTTELRLWQKTLITQLQNIFPLDANGEKLLAISQALFDQTNDKRDWVGALFGEDKTQARVVDERLSLISCRDPREECEVLVSRLQRALSEGVMPSEIVVITPRRAIHRQILPSLFKQSGIAYSNLGDSTEYFEWDKQLLKDLLQLYAVYQDDDIYLQPVQLGSVLVNPLMPWSLSFGQWLYEQYLYSNNFRFIKDTESSANHSEGFLALVELFDNPHHKELGEWLALIVDLLNFKQVPLLFSKAKMLALIDDAQQNRLNYDALSVFEALTKTAQQLSPQQISINANDDNWYLNSVVVLSENNILVNPVKHLFMVGFNDGAFEPNLSAPGVFQSDDWYAIQQLTDLNVYSPLVRDEAFVQRIKRFFTLATEGLHISLSEQGFDGSRLAPSQTLLDLAIALQPFDDVEPLSLITPIKSKPDNVAFVHYMEETLALPKVITQAPQDLMFDQDLIALHTDSEGKARTESPSSLDKMMVSPLAWLLDRQGIKDKHWEVQDLPVSLLGTVAHKVFELHFEPSTPYTLENYDALFEAAIVSEAEFLKSPKWRMQRNQLKQETYKALTLFVAWCDEEGWQTQMQEGRLTGELFGLPIKGFVDAVFTKGDTKLILDYKKSKSDKFAKRLDNGFDLQTMIYRKLIEQNGESASITHSGYFAFNDQTLVLDTEVNCSVKGLSQKITKTAITEQSLAAESAVTSRINELKAGRVVLNSLGDSKWWEDIGVNAAKYAIDDNPLVSAFMKGKGEEEIDQASMEEQ